jgi:hypothetical protein
MSLELSPFDRAVHDALRTSALRGEIAPANREIAILVGGAGEGRMNSALQRMGRLGVLRLIRHRFGRVVAFPDGVQTMEPTLEVMKARRGATFVPRIPKGWPVKTMDHDMEWPAEARFEDDPRAPAPGHPDGHRSPRQRTDHYQSYVGSSAAMCAL